MHRPTAVSLPLLALSLGILPGGLAAQRPEASGRFSGAYGVVVDSIHGGVLVGAKVRVDDTTQEGVTDSAGHFRIDSVTPGAHRLTLHHPLLDTLGMEIGSKPIDFDAGRVPVVTLGTPSPEAMLDIACGKVSNPEGAAGLLGVVRDPDTGVPAVGAEVTLRWQEIRVSKEAGVRRAQRVRTATVDSAGNYAICGLPADMTGLVRVTRGEAYTALVSIQIPEDALIALRSLSLGASQSLTDSATGTVRHLRRGPATLRGKILDNEGRPVVGARVEVPGTPNVGTSSSAGTFTLIDLPAGTQAVTARSVGYDPVEQIVELSAKTPREVTLSMRSIQVLPTLQTQAAAQSGLDKVGFTERKRTGMGRFLTHEQIAQRRPMVVSDLFSLMPGLRLTQDNQGNDVLQSSRASPNGPSGCTAVFVDHVRLIPPRPEQLVQHMNVMVRPEQVWAVEVYQPDQAPGEFMTAGQRCLTVAIWTQFGVGETEAQRGPGRDSTSTP